MTQTVLLALSGTASSQNKAHTSQSALHSSQLKGRERLIAPFLQPLAVNSSLFMSDIENLKTYDPFADTGEEEDTSGYIHIRIQQRNGRKTLTTVQGIVCEEKELKKMLKQMKTSFACNGTIINDEELGQVIQLQGDHRLKSRDYLAEKLKKDKNLFKIHGF
jgi:translation initiation factor 1